MTTTLLRLQQLRAELDTSAESGDFGPTILFTIRRELLLYLQQVPQWVLLAGAPTLAPRVEASVRQLLAPASFPARSRELQLSEARQALSLLEELQTPPSLLPGAGLPVPARGRQRS
ncbi:hypothetical protein [Hymenobacter yonginensis]|uniref:Uncharacterized protein n=1 Tax=Hymenobacter yonginensis TaxID=748197 RepID=A0ABY7PSV8_9BACT|nr:hypothetical protein [Hymenobacter yonginensis]WBO85986.1 hypothetical protein O9Z63_06965 [Hymenobacter yonginensis]